MEKSGLIWVWGALGRLPRDSGVGSEGSSLCLQEATRYMSKFKELMEVVLRDPCLLGLQREGGATLARLRRKAGQLDANPDVRYGC